ncbi:MAG: hypothetical protein PHD58_09585 [Anaerolineales bacterium]|nr:hypothetical protein [Anaerolineales bacterium]
MNSPLDQAVHLARQTGQRLLDYYHEPSLAARRKPDRSWVTEADLLADEWIARSLQERFPSDFILSEENHPTSPVAIEGGGWIIDPIDGTTNFMLGLPYWGVLVTYLWDGLPQATAQYFPVLEELYCASEGGGATLNARPIQVEQLIPDRGLSVFACCSRTYKRYTVTIPYKARIFGSAGYSMCSVARGVARLGFEARAKIWDLAGAWLLVQEAGGEIGLLEDGAPFPLAGGANYTEINYAVLAGASLETLQRARRQILPKAQTA